VLFLAAGEAARHVCCTRAVRPIVVVVEPAETGAVIRRPLVGDGMPLDDLAVLPAPVGVDSPPVGLEHRLVLPLVRQGVAAPALALLLRRGSTGGRSIDALRGGRRIVARVDDLPTRAAIRRFRRSCRSSPT